MTPTPTTRERIKGLLRDAVRECADAEDRPFSERIQHREKIIGPTADEIIALLSDRAGEGGGEAELADALADEDALRPFDRSRRLSAMRAALAPHPCREGEG